MAIYLPLDDEQTFVQEAATGALSRVADLEKVREALDGAALPDLWPVAVEAGWPGLLSAEGVDGTELGPFEAALVLRACGRVLADARLLGHLPAALLLEDAGAPEDLRRAVATGERRAALVDGELTHRGAPLDAVAGTVTGVLDAPGADVLVVVTAQGVGLLEDVADRVTAERSYDSTRALGTVGLEGAQLTPLDVPDPSRGRDLQRLLLAAESLGGAEACLEMSRAYAMDRHAFGRPIGSYQALKHKMVEMLRRIEGATSLVARAGHDPLLANAARVSAASALDFAAPENIFLHGGVGATWEHDASLFYRRAEVARRLAGGVDAAAATVAAQLLDGAQDGVPAEDAPVAAGASAA